MRLDVTQTHACMHARTCTRTIDIAKVYCTPNNYTIMHCIAGASLSEVVACYTKTDAQKLLITLQKDKSCYNLEVGCFGIPIADLNAIVYHLASTARRHTNNNGSIHH